MAKSVTAIKNILKREEGTLAKLQEAVTLTSHRETKSALRAVVKNRKEAIKIYKTIIKASEKCPAVKKTTVKKAAPKKAAAKKATAKKATATKRSACKTKKC
ncbi:MAG: hypothetical protein ACE5GY_06225 [Thermodesulfobacteriota bacterium]